MSDKATFAWADSLNLDVQRAQNKHQVQRVSIALHWSQTVPFVHRLCSNCKRTAQMGKGAQKWV
jgi:hypothetical protein